MLESSSIASRPVLAVAMRRKGLHGSTRDPRHADMRALLGLPHQSLGTILHLLERDNVVGRALGGAFSAADVGWLRSTAPRS